MLKNIKAAEDLANEALETAKANKRAEIRQAFDVDSAVPVTVNLVDYVAGYESGLKLDAAVRLAEKAGLTEVTFFDVNDEPHVLTIADADSVVMAVGNAYQVLFAKKNAKYAEIKAATIDTIDLVVW